MGYRLSLLCFVAGGISAQECGVVMTVEEAVRVAPRLQGKVRCVRGVIALSAEASSEMLALEPVLQGHRFAAAVGIVDGSILSGPRANAYKRESFEKMGALAASGEAEILLDVTVRVEIAYKKRLIERVMKEMEGTAVEGMLMGRQREVELVLLELVKVNRRLPYRRVVGR